MIKEIQEQQSMIVKQQEINNQQATTLNAMLKRIENLEFKKR
jgi:hypothetical protein